jgi:hypothetical protein
LEKSLFFVKHCTSELHPERLQLLSERALPIPDTAPVRPNPVPPQQAMLILGQPRQWHEEDAFFGPAGFGGDGKHLGC